MVSDKKLDKLESFLGRLNSKGMYFQTNIKLYNCTFYIKMESFTVSACSHSISAHLSSFLQFYAFNLPLLKRIRLKVTEHASAFYFKFLIYLLFFLDKN